MSLKLLNKTTLPIVRKTTSSGYIDPSTRKWIEGVDEAPFNIKCSVQPFRNGEEKINLPEGVESSDAINVFTKTELRTDDDELNQEADETTYRGFTYECFNVEHWVGYGLIPDHYRCVFIRKDKNDN